MDGGLIYAINYHQELFMIDPGNAQIIGRRKIEELKNSSQIISIQMMQIDPNILLIGSLFKEPDEKIERSTPYLLILFGDLMDPQAKLNFLPFEMNCSQIINSKRLPNFCFHYVRERYLLRWVAKVNNFLS